MRNECGYCSLNPPRIAEDKFAEVHFLPDPVLQGDAYKPFAEVYGLETTEESRPGLQSKANPTGNDKKMKKLLVADKVRDIVICAECGKPRVVYSAKKLSLNEKKELERVQEEMIYTCGAPLFPCSTESVHNMIVREGIICESQIETTYYAGKTATFPEVCVHCGDDEVSDVMMYQEIQRKKEEYGIVRPICNMCLSSGKIIVCRNALKVGKRARKS